MKIRNFRFLLSISVLCIFLAMNALNINSMNGVQPPSTHELIANQLSHYSSEVINRIYYINLKKNVKRRALMESWLKKQPIPYQRVEALAGNANDTCMKAVEPNRCRGIAGLSKTNLGIMRNFDTSGLTLVFEDDYYVKKDLLQAVQTTLELVPNDWDIIRWDCVGPIRTSFPIIVNTSSMVIFRTAHLLPCKEPTCFFCGSTHAMLWRETSLPKIERLWDQYPYDDIDCRLVTEAINAYSVNMQLGLNQAPHDEGSDITWVDWVPEKRRP